MSGAKMALRRLATRPGQTLLMVVVLALGIGTSTAVFTIVDSTIFRPPPFPHADRLVDVYDYNRASRGGGSSLSPEKILGWREQRSIFEALEGYAFRPVDLSGAGTPEQVSAVVVSTGLLPMLGLHPALGRGFGPGDGRPGAPRVALLGDGLWRQRYGADPDVLGRDILLNDEAYTIVGVMPRRPTFFRTEVGLLLPLDLEAVRDEASLRMFHGIGRLRPALAVPEAQAHADALADRLQEAMPLARGWDLRLEPRRVAFVDGTAQTVLFVLLGAVAGLLLIAWANVANLFLAHAWARERELAVRAALGASRGALVGEILGDSLVLALVGGALGVLLAHWAIAAMLAAAPDNLTFLTATPIEIDGRVIAAAVAATLATGLIFGLIPALRGSRPGVDAVLRGAGHAAGPRSSGRWPGGLVAVEVAVSLVLLTGTALMLRTVSGLAAVEPGFDVTGVVAFDLSLPADRYPDQTTRQQFFDQLGDRLTAHPGIAGVAVALSAPPRGGFTWGDVEIDGAADQPPVRLEIPMNYVDARYFEVLGIPVLAGRTFTGQDAETDGVIVSRAVADALLPGGDVVGRRFRFSPTSPWLEVVGVVGNVRASGPGDPISELNLYYPFPTRPAPLASPTPSTTSAIPQRTYASRTLLVRFDGALAQAGDVTRAIWAIDPALAVTSITPVADRYRAIFARERFLLLLMSVFGLMALVLTASGVFAVLSQAVVQRTREIGIRTALGATPRRVLQLIVGRGLAFTAIGVVAGVAGALALTGVLRRLLFGVTPHDPASFVAAVVGLLVVALAACWLPARRAVRIDPAVTLRE